MSGLWAPPQPLSHYTSPTLAYFKQLLPTTTTPGSTRMSTWAALAEADALSDDEIVGSDVVHVGATGAPSDPSEIDMNTWNWERLIPHLAGNAHLQRGSQIRPVRLVSNCLQRPPPAASTFSILHLCKSRTLATSQFFILLCLLPSTFYTFYFSYPERILELGASVMRFLHSLRCYLTCDCSHTDVCVCRRCGGCSDLALSHFWHATPRVSGRDSVSWVLGLGSWAILEGLWSRGRREGG